MQALLYIRRKGETAYRELGLQEMKELPQRGSDVTLEVDGRLAQARVVERRESVCNEHQRPRDLSLYLEAV